VSDTDVSAEFLRHRVAQLESENAHLREARAKYERIFERVPASVYVMDEHGAITDVNPYHLEHMGRGHTSKADYLGVCAFTRPSIVAAGLSDAFRRLVNGEDLDEREVYFPMSSGGAAIYVNLRGAPLRDDGRLIGAVVISEEITQLKNDQAELHRHREGLERTVAERTAQLERTVADLQSALGRVRRLTGLLPICSNCKQIRDDAGYWHQVEVYLHEHTDAAFTHGICPACMAKLYPDYEA
jgi:PAS domain S-box-containing protein